MREIIRRACRLVAAAIFVFTLFGISSVGEASPVITSVPSVILVGGTFQIKGTGFTAESVVNFFVATSKGPENHGPLTPLRWTASQLTVTVPVPPSDQLGEGFVSVQVVNKDQSFSKSNLGYALLQGSSSSGLPTLTGVNGKSLAATSRNPSYATNNVETVAVQGSLVTLNGRDFDTANGVAVDLFCACPGGKVGPFFLNPRNPGLSATAITFMLPSSGTGVPLTGPGSFVVSNKGVGVAYSKKSNAVRSTEPASRSRAQGCGRSR